MRSFAPPGIIRKLIQLFFIVHVATTWVAAAEWVVEGDVAHQKNVMIPMRDGIHLATDIYRPVMNGKPVEERLPIILSRTPYSKERTGFGAAKYFCKHGYIIATQDVRGRYKSEGEFSKYINEPEDGYDTVEWLARLTYGNGDVAMRGASYGAHVQAAAAKLNPPHLKTILVTRGGTSNSWDHAVRNHGAFALKQVSWAMNNVRKEAANPVTARMLERETVDDWYQALPFQRGRNPLSAAPEYEDYIFKLMTHGDYDEFWKQKGVNWVEHYDQTSDIPMLHAVGWYDNYCGSALENYVGLSKIKQSPVRLLMGPWTHGPFTTSHTGDVEFGRDAALPEYDLETHLRWYNHFLKGEQNGVGEEPPVKLFVMGTGDGRKDRNGRIFHGGFWRTAERWPLPETRYTRYYFHGDGRLDPAPPAPDEPSSTYTYDPKHPVPTIGGSMTGGGGPFDQRESPKFYGSRPPYLPLKARHDILVYQTEPLEQDVEITGPIVVQLHASSDRTDTDFTAKLIDVYPPSEDFPSGFDLNLTDGILRARYRNGPEKQELMEPGTIYEFTIKPFGTANVFKKGHRIRVDISSSNFPQYDVNPNTGEPLGLNRRFVPADNTIYHDAARPSFIILPIIPRT